MLNVTRNYLSGFQEISNYKQNSSTTNDIAILKIISYLFLISLGVAIYTAASLYGRLKKGPALKDESIVVKANQVLGTDTNLPPEKLPTIEAPTPITPQVTLEPTPSKPAIQPTSSTEEAPVIQAVVSPTAITPVETSLSPKLPQLYIRLDSEMSTCLPRNFEHSLKETKLFSSIKIVGAYEKIDDQNAIILDAIVAENRLQYVSNPTIYFCESEATARQTMENAVVVYIKRNSFREYQATTSYVDEVIALLKEYMKPKAPQVSLPSTTIHQTLAQTPVTPTNEPSAASTQEASVIQAVASSSAITPIEASLSHKLPQLYIRLDSEFSSCLPGNFDYLLKQTKLFSSIKIVNAYEKVDDQNAIILNAIGGGSRLFPVYTPTIYFCESLASVQTMENAVAIYVKRNSSGKYQSTTPYFDEVIDLLKEYIQAKAKSNSKV